MQRIPEVDASELDWLIFGQAGVLTTAQATSSIGRAALRTHLSQRRWRSLCHGIVLTQNGLLRPEQKLWVAVLAGGEGARLAGTSAATEGGVRGLPLEPIHVVVPARRTRARRLADLPPDMSSVRIHRSAVLPEEHLQAGSPPRTATARAIVDAAAWAATDSEARTIILKACQQRCVRPERLRQVLKVFPRIRRHQLINTAIDDISGGARSMPEINLVALCGRFGLPKPELQRPRVDAEGRNRYLDAYWPEFRLHMEVDGDHHRDVDHWTADMLRQNSIWIQGDRILRFPAWLIRAQPATVAAQIRAALAASPRVTPRSRDLAPPEQP